MQNFSEYMPYCDPIIKKTIFDFDSTCIGINRFRRSTCLLFYFYSLTSFCIFPTRISIHVVSSGRYSFIIVIDSAQRSFLFCFKTDVSGDRSFRVRFECKKIQFECVMRRNKEIDIITV